MNGEEVAAAVWTYAHGTQGVILARDPNLARQHPADYVNALKIMADPANHPLLVHCAAGAQRTSAAVMLYRKAFQNVPFEQSLDEARTFGHDPEDNPKLLKDLAEHGDAIIAEATAAVESGVGAGVGTGIGAAPVK